MKEKLITLKSRIESHQTLIDNSQLVHIVYPFLNLILENNFSNEKIEKWLEDNKSAIEIIEEEIARLERN